MKVQFTQQLAVLNRLNQKTPLKNKEHNEQSYSYNPIAYRDYNVNFGARLFRTPQNFYEQDFNEENMPKTLHKYIYESYDTDFKRTIPPAQAMKEVFGKINFAKDLDTVKMMFPDEPLFAELSSEPKRKSREGLLGMINLLKNDPEYADRTLFKNGDNDLGMYILKKIYLEGKTLKEINKDFAKDVSVHFKSYDIKPQDYNAFGIKFPNQSFWHSFIVTREEYPYVYIPRSAQAGGGIVSQGGARTSSSSTQHIVVKKRREPMSFDQRKRMSEFMINWHANLTPEQKAELSRKQLAGMEDSVFHNYFGEIVTVAQHKVNLSDKMSAYFEKVYGTPDYLAFMQDNKEKQSEIMSKFWKAHDMLREDYSRAMLETITEFDKAYGDDGENYDFLRLLAYARNVKDITEEGRDIRTQIRNEINAEKLRLESEKVQPEKTVQETKSETVDVDDLLNKAVKAENAQVFTFNLSDDTQVSFALNLDEMMTEKLEAEFSKLPKSFTKRYIDFFLKHPLATEEYKLSVLMNINDMKDYFDLVSDYSTYTEEEMELINKKVAVEIKDQLLPSEKTDKISEAIHADFDKKNKNLVASLDQCLREYISELAMPDNSKLRSIVEFQYQQMVKEGLISSKLAGAEKAVVIAKIYKEIVSLLMKFKTHRIAFMDTTTLSSGINLLQDTNSPDISSVDKLMQKYRKPLSDSEIRKLALKLADDIFNFDISDDKTFIFDDSLKAFFKTATETMKKNPDLRKHFIKILKDNYLTPQNSYYRYMLEAKADKKLYDAVLEKLIFDSMKSDIGFWQMAASLDPKLMEKNIKPVDLEMYNKLQEFRINAARKIILRKI